MPRSTKQNQLIDCRKEESSSDRHHAHRGRGGDRSKQLLSRDDIQSEYGLSRRWLELAALTGNGPAFIKISSRMVRYRRGDFENWLADRTVTSTSQTEGDQP